MGESALTDSFQDDLLGCQQFTRQRNFAGLTVSGSLAFRRSQGIDRWRQEQREQRTKRLRGDSFVS